MNFEPTDNDIDAARCVILPLDCARNDIADVITERVANQTFDAERLYEYTKAAFKQPSITLTSPTGVHNVAELAVFAALGALRVEYANPLAGTEFQDLEPEGSAERRMATLPFRKHPGLTIFHIRLRNYYLSTIQWLFEEKLPAELQSEIAAVLLCPDRTEESSTPNRPLYDRATPQDIHERYADRVTVDDSYLYISTDYASSRLQVQPKETSHVPGLYDESPPITTTEGRVSIPKERFWMKLGEYGWHAWAKLVNTAFHELPAREIDSLVERTPWVAKLIRGRFRRNNRVFVPYYGVSGVNNPLRDWQTQSDTAVTPRRAKLEDKRLVTIVDYLRGSPIEGFDEEIPLGELYDSLRWYFPAPHRPGNDVSTIETLETALTNASNSKISIFKDASGTKVMTMVEPRYSPFHPAESPVPWNRYYSLLQQQLNARPQLTTRSQSTRHARQPRINPILPEKFRYPQNRSYKEGVNHSNSPITPTSAHSRQIHNVEPLVTPTEIQGLSRDELVFLTRIGLAMERQLEDYSLTRSMRELRTKDRGDQLNIDEEKLIEEEWLEKHEEGRAVMYSVPQARRSILKIPNVSNDGFGETSTAEKSLHRRGIDMTAARLAAKPDVTRVIRYYDLWRLTNTSLEETLRETGLLSSRIDVIAFDGKIPVAAASVETQSNSPEKSRRSLNKLAAVSDDLETTLVTPNSAHLWRVMRLLQDPDYLEFDTFPQSNPKKWDRSNWEEKLANAGYAGQFFDELETYRSLDNSTLAKDDYRHQIILGNA